MLRFAPSPSGDMTIDNLRVAIFNHIVSKQKNEDLIIRIEDINKEEIIEGKDKEILEILNLFSIDYARVVHQSDSLKYHQKMVMSLMAQKKAFSCFCSDEKLNELKEDAKKENKPFEYDGFCSTLSDETVLNVNAPFTVRIQKPKESIKFNDLLKGTLNYQPYNVDSFIILKHDKTPTYDYACAADDMISNISTIIRNDDYLSNTSKQIHIRQELAYNKEIEYIHLTKISTENSKNIFVQDLINEGFLPSAIANYLVTLGNKTPNEIFTLEEAIEWFNIKEISNDSIIFNFEELKLINKKHLELLEEMRFSKILGFADKDIGKLGKVFLDEKNTIKEIKEIIDSIFKEKKPCKGFEEESKKIKECLQNAPYIENFKDLKTYLSKETSLKEESILKPLSYLLTNGNYQSKLSDIYPLIKNYLGEIIK